MQVLDKGKLLGVKPSRAGSANPPFPMGTTLSFEDVFALHVGTAILAQLHLTYPRTCP